jgi:hypothetical protein
MAIAVPAFAAAFASRPETGRASALAEMRAAWSGTGVIHAKFISQSGDLAVEEWLDRQSGATRKVDFEDPADHVNSEIIVQRGLTMTRWNTYAPDVTYVTRLAEETDPWLAPASLLLGVQRALNSGNAEILGGTTFRGRDAWKVRLKAQPAPEARTAPDVSALVDQATLLPLRFIFSAPTGETGTLDVQAEDLAAGAKTDELFTTNRSWTLKDTRLLFDELKTQVPFRAYTLGRAHNGLRFGTAALHETKGTSPRFPLQPELFISYVHGGPYSDPDLTLTEHAAGTEDAESRVAAFKAEGTPRTVRIAGAQRSVFLLDPEGQHVYFAVVIGSTLVKGSANTSSDELLRTLMFLRPVA